jgi:dienelactone hydrolase
MSTTTYEFAGEPNERPVVLYEPDNDSTGLPVFLFLCGARDAVDSMNDEEYMRAMAKRGFVAGTADWPNQFSDYSYALTTNTILDYLDMTAGRVVPNVFDKLCNRPRADCSNGVALAGFSMGGFQTMFAPRHDPRITAILALSTGWLEPSNPLFFTLSDQEQSKYLPTKSRLLISGAADTVLPPGAERSLAFYTYIDCQQSHSCIQEDGSGFVIIPEAPHQFTQNRYPSSCFTRMKCVYGENDEQWGLKSTLDWLASTAAPTKAIISDGSEDLFACDPESTLEETPANFFMDGGMECQEISYTAMFKVFSSFDSNQDGSLSQDEIPALTREIERQGHSGPDKTINRPLDSDLDGTISWNEFLGAQAKVGASAAEDKLKEEKLTAFWLGGSICPYYTNDVLDATSHSKDSNATKRCIYDCAASPWAKQCWDSRDSKKGLATMPWATVLGQTIEAGVELPPFKVTKVNPLFDYEGVSLEVIEGKSTRQRDRKGTIA